MNDYNELITYSPFFLRIHWRHFELSCTRKSICISGKDNQDLMFHINYGKRLILCCSEKQERKTEQISRPPNQIILWLPFHSD